MNIRGRLGSAMRAGVALGGVLGSLAVASPAWADNTTLAIAYSGAGYQVAATGTAKALSVAGVEGKASSDTSQAASVPTVAPGQPLTVSVLVESTHAVNEGTVTFLLDNATLTTVSVTPQQVLMPGALPGPGTPAHGILMATAGGASFTFRVPAGDHNFVVKYSGSTHFASNVYATSLSSRAHTSLDLSCGCQQNGTPVGSCVATGQPKSPAGEKLVCKSNVWAETMTPNTATATWGPGPAGNATVNIQGIGAVTAPAVGVGTSTVVATATVNVPAAGGTLAATSSFTPSNPAQASPSTGPSASIQVAGP
jgi:hypothetical protein